MADDFTPKFADLVRNTTTTVGTGSFVLGPPVNGFTGFLAALQPGDSFYYSAIGVDRPAEREIGRGTLQSNGTITRQPVSGSPTNFSSGTKTVALVAAAEWFQNMQSAGAAGGGQASAATRDELSRMPQASQAATLREGGRAGLFVFDAADRSADVARDPRQGLFVAPSSDSSGASGAWVRKYDSAVNVQWFGTAGDDSTDDHAAFAAAIAALPDRGGTLYVPQGEYRLSQTLHIARPVRIVGDGIGQNPGIIDGTSYNAADMHHGTILHFDAGIEGIVFHPHTTEDDPVLVAASPNAYWNERSALYSQLRDLTLLSGNRTRPAYSEGRNGLRTKTVISVENVWILGFADNGVNISATPSASDPTGADWGNADMAQFKNVICVLNANNGFRIEGYDAQVCTFVGCNASMNGGWGFDDAGFLGNSYIGCHVMGNNQTGMASADPQAGSFRCSNINACSVYLGCYIETPTVGEITDLSEACIVIGGIMAGDRYYGAANKALVLGGGGVSAGALGYYNKTGDTVVRSGIGGNPVSSPGNVAFWFGCEEESAGALDWRWKYDSAANSWSMEFANAGAGGTPYQVASSGSNWRTTTVYGPSFPQGIFLGSNGAGPRIFYGTTAPSAGNWIVGDFLFNSAASGPVGWRCTVAGSPGTWLAVHTAPPVTSQAGTAYTAVLADANGYIRFTSAAAATFTIPPNSAAAFPIGTVIEIEQAGAGALSVAAGAGVTINSRAGDQTLAGQYAVAAVKKVAADSWTLTGDL